MPFIDEITEQPEVVARLLTAAADPVAAVASAIRGRYDHVILVARGSSTLVASLALFKGLDPDAPRSLRKVTRTVE
jgi:fructoselysine-6-P-deglycase FrlB-like protein